MRSFRTRLAVLSALISAVIISGFGIAGFFLTKRVLLQSVDMQLAVPLDRIARDLHPRTDLPRVRENADLVHGPDVKEGKVLVMMREDWTDEILYQDPDGDWLNQVDQAALAHKVPLDGKGKGKGFRPYIPEGEREPNDMRPPPPLPGEVFFGDGPPKGQKGKKGRFFEEGPLEVSYDFMTTGTENWRVGILHKRGYTVVMARNLADYHAEMNKVLRLVFIGAPFCLLVIGAGGWLVGERAMKPVNAIAETARNITARQLHERIPTKHGEYLEFANLVSVFNSMLDRLQEGFSHAVRFSADVSHELKTPITIMQAELDSAVKNCEAGSSEEQALRVIGEECQRLKSITGSLMLMSQAESGRLVARQDEFSLSDQVNDLVEDTEILCESSQLTLTSEVEPGIEITSDRVLLQQALQNLVSNAVKYNEPDGWVKISLQKHDLSMETIFRVSNSGPGIPPEDAEHIFERFYRVDKARDRSVDGFGLGLNLSYEIISVLGGELELLKSDSEGTLFQVRLPIRPPTDS